jgi:hypothetical protein
MLIFVLSFVVGLVVGWHVPQPAWAKKAEEEVVAAAKKVKKK